ncbi:ABC transporter ATP-binding protein [Actinoalloteichus hymeniacidonis]|uniref:ABC-type multidrug transport system, ATPase component n=1 Tax=Actinoalloteichus hymeniacidonis TaxID=340345 RepID=A0AAC9N0L4_9PSEU|nr:ABC transporter ATP-binding protein [Actinoalloteichus hymeniacidonis]AOS65026.1 ABC-type multidrug transport system, ATPase component [Actinoalloteichus hymeniacidonis]MBB5906895.1 ABC-2 type transport system ATP-binding protein [Actinoalloteichus hymeniacidonis]
MAIIEVDHLVKRYGDHTTVQGIDFTVDQGEIFGILGPNGAGKTTTVECIEGLRTPDGGSTRVCGIDSQDDTGELRQLLGAQLQESELPAKLKVGEAMELYSSFYRRPADWRELLEALRLTDKIDTQFRKLSGGQKQRLSIALAVIGNPRVTVLDELTTGLDPQARRDAWDLIETIRDRGVTILLVTHFMEEAERLCDRLALIDAGRLIALDSPAGLVAMVDDRQRLRFRPSAPLDHAELAALPEVTTVEHSGDQIVVSGTRDVLLAVTTVLNRHRITAAGLRVEQASLDDAFVALTGHSVDASGRP